MVRRVQTPETGTTRFSGCGSFDRLLCALWNRGLCGTKKRKLVVRVRSSFATNFFMKLLVNVYLPYVIVGTENVLDREHCSQHRVILVVVFVHSVTTYQIDITNLL